jgi:hypothetical protein
VKTIVPFGFFSIGGKILAAIFMLNVCSIAAVLPADQELLDKYEGQYQAETNPAQKAKILAKLGPLKIDQARKRLDEGQDEKSLAALEQYRDKVREAIAALTAAGIDAEKHPAGFKELHIGVRETIRRLDDFIVSVPVDERPWFRAVRSDLDDLQNSLLDALFPKPGATKKKDKPQ